MSEHERQSICSTIACALVFACALYGPFAPTARAYESQATAAPAARASEEEKLQQHRRYARRNGDSLELTLATGAKLKLTDRGTRYKFVDYVAPIDRFVVSALLPEGRTYLLIDRKTGKRVGID